MRETQTRQTHSPNQAQQTSSARMPAGKSRQARENEHNNPITQAEKGLRNTRDQLSGSLRQQQDLHSQLDNAGPFTVLTGQRATLERMLKAEQERAEKLQESIRKQKEQIYAAKRAEAGVKEAEAKARSAKTAVEKQKARIEAEKERNKAEDAAKAARQSRREGVRGGAKAYLDASRKDTDQIPANQREINKHQDIKTDRQLTRTQHVDASKPSGTQSSRLAQAIEKQEKETDRLLRTAGGQATNVESAQQRASSVSIVDQISGLKKGLDDENKNDRKLLNGSNERSAQSLQQEEKLKATFTAVSTLEQRAKRFEELGDKAEAERLRKEAKQLIDQVLDVQQRQKQGARQRQDAEGRDYIQAQGRVNQQYEAAADRVDKAAKVTQVTRDTGIVIVAAGATVLTGGAAAGAGMGALATFGAATASGAAAGTALGALSNSTGAVSSISTGYKTSEQAWSDAKNQTVLDAKTSLFTAAGAALGLGVTGKIAQSSVAAKIGLNGTRIVAGSTQGGISATATTTLSIGDRALGAVQEFEALKRNGTVQEKDRAKFFAERGLSPTEIAKEIALSSATGFLSGGIGAKADIVKDLKPSVWAKVGAATLDTTGAAAVGFGSAYVRNGGTITFDDVLNEAVGSASGLAQGHFVSQRVKQLHDSQIDVQPREQAARMLAGDAGPLAVAVKKSDIRQSTNGVVYLKKPSDIPKLYLAMRTSEGTSSEVARSEAHGVRAFYDARTGTIYARDLPIGRDQNGASRMSSVSREERLLHGALLTHELTHRTTDNEHTAFTSMVNYVKRYNQRTEALNRKPENTRNKPLYEIRFSDQGVSISKMQAGQRPQYPNDSTIHRFIESRYSDSLPSANALAAFKTSNQDENTALKLKETDFSKYTLLAPNHTDIISYDEFNKLRKEVVNKHAEKNGEMNLTEIEINQYSNQIIGFFDESCGRIIFPQGTPGAGEKLRKNKVSAASISAIHILDPKTIRTSQDSIDGQKLANYVENMAQNGFVVSHDYTAKKLTIINIIEMPDGILTSTDNRRIVAAEQSGTPIIGIVRHHSDKICNSAGRNFRIRRVDSMGNVIIACPETWGDAVLYRTHANNFNWGELHPFGTFTRPQNRESKKK